MNSAGHLRFPKRYLTLVEVVLPRLSWVLVNAQWASYIHSHASGLCLSTALPGHEVGWGRTFYATSWLKSKQLWGSVSLYFTQYTFGIELSDRFLVRLPVLSHWEFSSWKTGLLSNLSGHMRNRMTGSRVSGLPLRVDRHVLACAWPEGPRPLRKMESNSCSVQFPSYSLPFSSSEMLFKILLGSRLIHNMLVFFTWHGRKCLLLSGSLCSSALQITLLEVSLHQHSKEPVWPDWSTREATV